MNLVVTGSSSGIGRALVEHLLEAGNAVVGLARSTQDDLVRRHPGRFHAAACDVADWKSVAAAATKVRDTLGSVDGLITCAGAHGEVGRAVTADPLKWSATIRTNLDGTFNAIRGFHPLLAKASRRAKIVCFSGGGASKSRPNFSAYGAAKTAVVRLVENIADEEREQPLDINAIAPGSINTRLTDEILSLGPSVVGAAEYDTALKQKKSGGASLEKVLGLVDWLLSPASDGISGRLLAAPWDPWASLVTQKAAVAKSEIYMLRRILPEERGMIFVNMAKSKKIAVIGYGYWGPKLVRNFAQSGAFGKVVVCDSSPTRLEQARRDNPYVEFAGDFSKIIADADVNAVAIATPVDTHFILARAAIEAGKHVLVEKPLCSRHADAQALVDLAKAKRVVLMVDHTFVYHPAVQRIRQLIQAGELGKLNYIDSTRINLGLFQHDVNVLWDLAVHDIAIINFLTAERPEIVQAIGARHTSSPLENIGILTLRYASGLFVHINCSWVSPVKIRHVLVGGDRKMVVYDDLDANEPVKIYDSGVIARTDEERNRLRFEYRAGDVYSPKIQPREALANLVADFVKAVTDGSKPDSDGEFGADTVKILEAAQRSVTSGGREVTVEWKH